MLYVLLLQWFKNLIARFYKSSSYNQHNDLLLHCALTWLAWWMNGMACKNILFSHKTISTKQRRIIYKPKRRKLNRACIFFPWYMLEYHFLYILKGLIALHREQEHDAVLCVVNTHQRVISRTRGTHYHHHHQQPHHYKDTKYWSHFHFTKWINCTRTSRCIITESENKI